MSEERINELRDQIDAIDRQLLDLLSERTGFAKEVGKTKMAMNADSFYRADREAKLLEKVKAYNKGPLKDEGIANIFREIMSATLAVEHPISVAALGPAGTYSHAATLKRFGHSVTTKLVDTMQDVFRLVSAEHVDYGVVPIENSTEGGVSQAMDLITESKLRACGEIILPVHHSFWSQDGNNEITLICAHPQALAQCQLWTSAHYPGVPTQAVSSNAQATKMASENGTIGAIAGKEAGAIYGLFERNTAIEDFEGNATRFLQIGRHDIEPCGNDKTSIILAAPHQPGGLYAMLEPFYRNNIDMTRLESRPSKNGNWDYLFFIDVIGHAQVDPLAEAIEEIRSLPGSMLRILGSYPQAMI